MGDKFFIDSNLLIYSVSVDFQKREQVQLLLRSETPLVISTQVVSEFCNVCLKKNLLSVKDLPEFVHEFYAFFEIVILGEATIQRSLSVKERYGFSYYDALIIASALESSCTVLFSEDLQHNQIIEGVLQIQNPFIN